MRVSLMVNYHGDVRNNKSDRRITEQLEPIALEACVI